ncbi:hypothetical protein ISN44_As01g037140, partial [Arabidopsis suecica]
MGGNRFKYQNFKKNSKMILKLLPSLKVACGFGSKPAFPRLS